MRASRRYIRVHIRVVIHDLWITIGRITGPLKVTCFQAVESVAGSRIEFVRSRKMDNKWIKINYLPLHLFKRLIVLINDYEKSAFQRADRRFIGRYAIRAVFLRRPHSRAPADHRTLRLSNDSELLIRALPGGRLVSQDRRKKLIRIWFIYSAQSCVMPPMAECEQKSLSKKSAFIRSEAKKRLQTMEILNAD